MVSLITVEVHARDVIDKLGKSGATSIADFEWVSQLRFYWDKELNDCVVKQVGVGGRGRRMQEIQCLVARTWLMTVVLGQGALRTSARVFPAS